MSDALVSRRFVALLRRTERQKARAVKSSRIIIHRRVDKKAMGVVAVIREISRARLHLGNADCYCAPS